MINKTLINLTATEITVTTGGLCACLCNGEYKISRYENTIYFAYQGKPQLVESQAQCMRICPNPDIAVCHELENKQYIHDPAMLSPRAINIKFVPGQTNNGDSW